MNTVTAPAVPADARRSSVSRSMVAATVAGNALEFYDFVTYAFFAVYIGRAFFPSTVPFVSLLASVAVFGVGFFTRPLGAVVIGAFADRAGRRPAMLLTIGFITTGTLGLAITPSYAEIGVTAPVIVVLCRLIQGIALGGEVGPSTSFLIEIAPPGKRGLYSSWQLASQGGASIAAGMMGIAMSATLTPDQLQAWGWRVPFALGLWLIPLAIFLRRRMPETLDHGDVPESVAPRARSALLRDNAWLMTLAVALTLGGTVSTYVGLYMTTFAITVLKLPATAAMSATAVFGIATFGCSLLGGWLSDTIGRKPVMLCARLVLLLATYPAFMLLVANRNLGVLLCVTALIAAATALGSGAGMVVLPELLPLRIRALGMSITYAIGVSLFGGTTQFVITWLIGATHNPLAPAWYVVGTSVIALLALLQLPESHRRSLTR